jgi:hypothetical protein
LHLPFQLDLSQQFAARQGHPYNITSGTSVVYAKPKFQKGNTTGDNVTGLGTPNCQAFINQVLKAIE